MNARTQPKTTPARPGEPRLADLGGQYAPAQGDSTHPTDALFEWFLSELAGQPEASHW